MTFWMILCSCLCGNSLGEDHFLFQHDNTPVHKARSIQKWSVDRMEELDWPAQSPDLNPIEHFCDEVEH